MAKRDDLGYLGTEFQYRLAHHFMDDKKFFRDVSDMVDTNMFTDVNVRRFMGTLKNFFDINDYVPSYEQAEIELRSTTNSDQDIEFVVEIVKKIKNTTCEGADSIKTKAHKFFKQQNMAKVYNQMGKFISDGDIDKYDELEELIRNALATGNREEIGIHLRDNLGEVLSEDYRKVVPTGVKGVDDALEGGLGRGELGVIIGPSSFGKEQPISELVCTPDGFRTMGSIEVGDFVIGGNGKPVKVINTFPQGVKDVYKVTFSDKVSVECGIDHLWNVNSVYQRCGKKYVSGVSKSRDDKYYIPDHTYQTLSLKQILEKGLFKNYAGHPKRHNFKVPMPEAVQFNTIDIPETLPPYFIGAFIGDGCFSRMDITSVDQEIIDKICKITNVVSLNNSTRDPHITKIQLSYLLKEQLYKYFTLEEKSEDKFIPNDYLYNSIENRIELLNGLMDTDGTCQKNGCSCYNTKSKQLAEDVKTLVLSLGGFAIVREKNASYFNKKYNIGVDCGIHYEVTITLIDTTIPIFNLNRKQDRVNYRTSKKTLRFIESVELVRQEESKCIMLESEDGLYLTRDFIVTHNTSLTTSFANHAALNNFKVLQIIFEDKEKQIQRKHIGKITGVEARDLSKPENIEMVKDIMSYTDAFDENLVIKKFNTGEVNPVQIRTYIKRLINTGFNPDMVIVDYFECLVASKNFKDQWTGEGHTMRQLEAIASDLDIALWVPTQGTKDSLNAEIVTMDKAGGSFKKIQIAHIVISIARSMEDMENNIATIAVLKNRSGKSGRVMEGASFNNGTCEINTDNIQMFEGMTDYNSSEAEKKQEKTKDILEAARLRRELAKKEKEEQNN